MKFRKLMALIAVLAVSFMLTACGGGGDGDGNGGGGGTTTTGLGGAGAGSIFVGSTVSLQNGAETTLATRTTNSVGAYEFAVVPESGPYVVKLAGGTEYFNATTSEDNNATLYGVIPLANGTVDVNVTPITSFAYWVAKCRAVSRGDDINTDDINFALSYASNTFGGVEVNGWSPIFLTDGNGTETLSYRAMMKLMDAMVEGAAGTTVTAGSVDYAGYVMTLGLDACDGAVDGNLGLNATAVNDLVAENSLPAAFQYGSAAAANMSGSFTTEANAFNADPSPFFNEAAAELQAEAAGTSQTAPVFTTLIADAQALTPAVTPNPPVAIAVVDGSNVTISNFVFQTGNAETKTGTAQLLLSNGTVASVDDSLKPSNITFAPLGGNLVVTPGAANDTNGTALQRGFSLDYTGTGDNTASLTVAFSGLEKSVPIMFVDPNFTDYPTELNLNLSPNSTNPAGLSSLSVSPLVLDAQNVPAPIANATVVVSVDTGMLIKGGTINQVSSFEVVTDGNNPSAPTSFTYIPAAGDNFANGTVVFFRGTSTIGNFTVNTVETLTLTRP